MVSGREKSNAGKGMESGKGGPHWEGDLEEGKAVPENSREASVGAAEGTGGLRGPGEIS